MKNKILILIAFISISLFAQKPTVNQVIWKETTTAQRDALVISAGTFPEIYNITTAQKEQWNGASWEAISVSTPTEVVVTTATYALLEADIKAWRPHFFTSTNVVITIPAITYEGLNVVPMIHQGAGNVTIQAGAGVTFADQTFSSAYGFTIISREQDIWTMYSREIEGGGGGSGVNNPMTETLFTGGFDIETGSASSNINFKSQNSFNFFADNYDSSAGASFVFHDFDKELMRLAADINNFRAFLDIGDPDSSAGVLELNASTVLGGELFIYNPSSLDTEIDRYGLYTINGNLRLHGLQGTNGSTSIPAFGINKNDLSVTFGNYSFPRADGNAGQVLKTDGSGLLTFQNESGGGGGTPTQLAQGTAYTTLGELLNDSFAGTSLNASNWSSVAGADFTVNNKVIVASGASDWSEAIESTKFFAYDKLEFIIDFKAVTKNSGDAWGISQGSYPTFSQFAGIYYFKFNQETGVFSSGNTVDANSHFAPPIDFVAGDNIVVTLRRHPSLTLIEIENITNTTVAKVFAEFPVSKMGTSGQPRITFLGGQQEFNNVTVSSNVRNFGGTFGTVLLGDSITQGAGASTVQNQWVDLLFNNQQHLYENLGYNSWATNEFTAPVVTELLGSINAKYCVIALGYNDQSRSVATATYTTNLETIASTAQGLGYETIMITPFPRLGGTNAAYVTAMQTAATNSGSIFVDLTPYLGNIVDRDLIFDSIHPNDFGHKSTADAVKQVRPELTQDLLTDIENVDVYLRGIAQSSEELPLVALDEQSRVVKLNADKYINKDWLLLQPNLDSDEEIYQTQEGNVGFKGSLKNEKPYIQANLKGLRIGFKTNSDVLDASSNIQIHDSSVGGGGGNPQGFLDWTGVGNIQISTAGGAGTRTTAAANISGNKNLLLNSKGTGEILGNNNIFISTKQGSTSGSRNIFIGSDAGRGVLTGSEVIILNSDQTQQSLPSSLNSFIGLGNLNGSGSITNGTVVINPTRDGTKTFYLGGVTGFGNQNLDIYSGSPAGSNQNGGLTTFFGSKSSGTGTGGGYSFKTTVSSSSGNTQNTYEDALDIRTTKIEAFKPIKPPAYTVATLPTGEEGMTAYVTDASSITYRATATGGGTGKALVFFDGTNWIYY
jgi:lysophospholipase L1-like esterase